MKNEAEKKTKKTKKHTTPLTNHCTQKRNPLWIQWKWKKKFCWKKIRKLSEYRYTLTWKFVAQPSNQVRTVRVECWKETVKYKLINNNILFSSTALLLVFVIFPHFAYIHLVLPQSNGLRNYAQITAIHDIHCNGTQFYRRWLFAFISN